MKELRYINHVHLHDRHPGGGGLHAPLGMTGLPWRRAIGCLQNAGWNGAITLEIRYRYALELGQPWDVLAASFDQVRRVLTGE
jgi:sugar phosphate isomerase/epimerase